MSLNCEELQELTVLEALGALRGEDRARLQERLARDPAARRELGRFHDALAGWAAATLPRKIPPAAVRERVLERIRTTAQARPGAAAEGPQGPPVPEGFQFVRADAPWLPAPLPGGRFKLLSAGPGQDHVTLLIELQPGAVYPEHDHAGVEEMYILTGDLQSEGRHLGPGDFLRAEPGTHHHELRTLGGCTALMVVPVTALEALGTGG